ncbi:MAG: RNA-directed DNA polymerase [Bacteroidales bacterium]|nr:RNA-directed DNA polymerase [Bacteroidales bacterium]
MKADQKQIQEIRDRFAKMQNKTDLLDLLNFAKGILFLQKSNSKSLRLSTLNWYADPRLSAGKRYIEFSIPKKNGGQRKIHSPARSLKTIQRCLNLILQCIYDPHPAAMGFRPGFSVVDNATKHTGKNFVYNLDLKEFFPSIELHRVKACFKNPPFNLTGDREPLAFFLANLCCHEQEVEREGKPLVLSVLPQGAPTSPTITNIVANKLDRKLSGLANRFGACYSRYADDITFSSIHYIYGRNGDFINELKKIIANQKFKINSLKTRLQTKSKRQEVTGLIVNEHVNVNNIYLKNIRQTLHIWKKFGIDNAWKYYTENEDTRTTNKENSSLLVQIMNGKLQYALTVRGKEDFLINKYFTILKDLMADKRSIPDQNLELILQVLLTEGLDEAMEKYTNNISQGNGK